MPHMFPTPCAALYPSTASVKSQEIYQREYNERRDKLPRGKNFLTGETVRTMVRCRMACHVAAYLTNFAIGPVRSSPNGQIEIDQILAEKDVEKRAQAKKGGKGERVSAPHAFNQHRSETDNRTSQGREEES